MKLIGKHAEKALQYHLTYAYIAAGLSFCAYLFNFISSTISALFVVSAIILICVKSMYMDKNIAINNFSKKSFNAGYNLSGVAAEHNVIETDLNIKQNVITFGGYYPFLGAGRRARNWNFSINSSKSSKKRDNDCVSDLPGKISTDELYTAVLNGINEKDLPSITQEYILFADGHEVDKSKKLLPNKVGEPIDNLDKDDLIQEGHSNIYNDWRTYFCLRYHDKLRSTLFSTFLRFSKVGESIFAECSFYILPPINENRFNIDRLALNDDFLIIKTGLVTLASVVVALIMISNGLSLAPIFILLILTLYPLFVVFRGRIREFSENKDLKKKIERGEPHNYGAISTFRELIASSNYKNYFSAQDIIMVQNSIEQAIVYSVADLLDSKGIDSSFLRKDMIAYVNQGIMMFGGTIEAEQVVGVGIASKTLNQIKDLPQKYLEERK